MKLLILIDREEETEIQKCAGWWNVILDSTMDADRFPLAEPSTAPPADTTNGVWMEVVSTTTVRQQQHLNVTLILKVLIAGKTVKD